MKKVFRLIGLVIAGVLLQSQGCQEVSQGVCQGEWTATPGTPVGLDAGTQLTVGFYNVENLFDTLDDVRNAEDDWLLEEEAIGWDEGNYEIKLQNLSRAISSMDEGGPDLLGIAEVENACVLADLIHTESLSPKGYRIVHEESGDHRGIDVAFLYDPNFFTYQSHKTYTVTFANTDYTSRDILAVEGSIDGQHLWVIVNHWPSRGGGQVETAPKRMAAARRVRSLVDDLTNADPEVGIIVMGDFNDDPTDPSIMSVLGAEDEADEDLDVSELFNPMAAIHDPESEGSLTYRGKYNLFDQIMLNGSLLDSKKPLSYVPGSVSIHHPNFMRFRGRGPSRAIHRGEFKPYGFSDHFPVMVTLSANQ